MSKSLPNRVLIISCQVKNTIQTDDPYTTVRRLVDTCSELSERDVIERYLHIGGAQWVRPQDGKFELLDNGMELMDEDQLPDGMLYDPHSGWVLVAVPRHLEYMALELFESIWDAYSETEQQDEYCTDGTVLKMTVRTEETDGYTFHDVEHVAYAAF